MRKASAHATSARVLLAGAELNPIAKAGGLGDVLSALPIALQPLVDWVGVALPFYNMIPRGKLRNLKHVCTVPVALGKTTIPVSVWQSYLPQAKAAATTSITSRPHPIPLYLFHNPKYLSRGTPYHGQSVYDPLRDKAAESLIGQRLRFLVFSAAIHSFLQQAEAPHITAVHAHDYHTAPLLNWLAQDSALKNITRILTIHNLAVTGNVPAKYLKLFSWSVPALGSKQELQRKHGPRLLRLGLNAANAITTVSPQYAKEILTPHYGVGMNTILKKYRSHTTGILNGLDTEYFNPQTDPAIAHHYSAQRLDGKLKNKSALQRRGRLPIDSTVPVIGLVHRLTSQKGLDLLVELMPKLLQLPAQFVFVGAGQKKYEQAFTAAAKLAPDKFYFYNKFDIHFGQQTYAGSDMFLMPSQFEPCGLSQLIAMRYGSVPIVRATGGLKNTVFEGKNGFVFTTYSVTALWRSIQRAVDTYYQRPAKWSALVQRGMRADYSWHKSAKQYAKLYTSSSH